MSDDAFEENDDQDLEAGAETETGTHIVPITVRSPSRSRSPPSITIGHDNGDIATVSTLHNYELGQAPTYLEAMSALDPDAPQRPQVPAPRPGALQRTASGFKELISRPFAPGSFRPGPSTSGNQVPGQQTPPDGRSRSGSTSALLHPTISRYSTASTSTEYPSPWASSHSLLISPPVPNSAMRASFDGTSIPKGGLTKEQMRFLSSNEAVNLVGVKMEDIGARKQRRRSDFSGTPRASRSPSAGIEELPPPSWEQLDGERRMSEAFERRNLGIPAERDNVEEHAVELDEAGDGPSINVTEEGNDDGPEPSPTQAYMPEGSTNTEHASSDLQPPQIQVTTR